MHTVHLKSASAIFAACLAAGCASVFGPSPSEEITATLEQFHAAERSGDLAQVLDTFSDDYSNSKGATKSLLRGFFEPLIDQGLLQTMTISVENTEVTVDGDTATAFPVSYSTAAGTITYTYEFAKEPDGAWRIVKSEPI